jgi:hypothetical protein
MLAMQARLMHAARELHERQSGHAEDATEVH